MIVARLAMAAVMTATNAPGAVLAVEAQVASDTLLDIDLTVDAEAAVASLASAQCVGVRATVDGAALPISDWSFEEGLDSRIASWSLTGSWPSSLGGPADYRGGAPPGLKAVNLYGIYRTTSSVREIALVYNGKVETWSRSRRSDGSDTIALSGGCAMARYDRLEGTAKVPPGHGLSRGQYVAQLAASAGVPTVALPHGGQFFKSIEVADEPWLEPALQVYRVSGYTLRADRLGRVEAVVDGYDGGRPVDLELTAICAGSLAVSASADLPSRVILTGTSQVLRGECARVPLEPKRTTTEGPYAPVAAVFQQAGDGSLTATGLSFEEAQRIVQIVEVTGEESCGVTLLERVVTWGYWNPQAARYTVDSAGNRSAEIGVYVVDPEAGDFDDALAYQRRYETLVVTAHEERRHTYDERGFKVRTVARRQVPRMTRAAIKGRSDPAVSWDEALWINNRKLLGNGGGVVESAEAMPNAESIFGGGFLSPTHETEREIWEWTVDDDGHVTQESRTLWKWWIRKGQLWLYGENETGASETELFSVYETETVDYVPDGAAHKAIRQITTGEDKPTTIIEPRDGYLPAAERDPNLEPDADSYPDGRPAHRQEVAQWTAEVRDSAREALLGERTVRRSEPWAESGAEGLAMAARELREAGAVSISIDVPCNYFARPGWRVGLQLWGMDLIGNGAGEREEIFLRRVAHKGSARQPVITTLGGRIYG